MIEKFLKLYPGERPFTHLEVCESAHICGIKILEGLWIGEVERFCPLENLDRRGGIFSIYLDRGLNCGHDVVLNVSINRMVVLYRVREFLSSRNSAGSREGEGENRSCRIQR